MRERDNETNLSNIPKLKGFRMAMLNIASLPKHFDKIRQLLHNKKLDVLALSETRLDSYILMTL